MTTAPGASGASTSACPEPSVSGEIAARADLDGDGVAELFVRTTGGASTDTIGVFRIDGCAAVPVTLSGRPAQFPVGASVRNIAGLGCNAGGSGPVVAYEGHSDDGETYDVTWRQFSYDGAALTQADAGSGAVRAGGQLSNEAGDPLFTAGGDNLDCG